MSQADLPQDRQLFEIRFRQVADPYRWLSVAHQRVQHHHSACRRDGVISAIIGLHAPQLGGLSIDARSGFVRSDYAAGTHIVQNGLGGSAKVSHARRTAFTTPQADVQSKQDMQEVLYLHIAEEMRQMQIMHHRFQARAKGPLGFQACRVVCRLCLPTRRTTDLTAVSLDHDWTHKRQVYDLAAAHHFLLHHAQVGSARGAAFDTHLHHHIRCGGCSAGA